MPPTGWAPIQQASECYFRIFLKPDHILGILNFNAIFFKKKLIQQAKHQEPEKPAKESNYKHCCPLLGFPNPSALATTMIGLYSCGS
jgi:hypothetical protein